MSGHVVAREGDPSGTIYIVRSGEFQIEKSLASIRNTRDELDQKQSEDVKRIVGIDKIKKHSQSPSPEKAQKPLAAYLKSDV